MWGEVGKNFLSLALELTLLFISISFIINMMQGLIVA
jgi:hypothetical protein